MAGPITISIIGDNRGLNSSLGQSETRLKRLGSVAGKAGKAVGAGLLVAAAGAAAWGVESVKSLMRIERINKQTATVIQSTGRAAGVSAKHVETLAGDLENLTASEAEATQEGANLLLTFTNIRNGAGKSNKIFDQTTKIMVDMSRALGTDAKGSAVQLGKALNDPVKGISALSRVGVSFTEQQKSQIQTMVDSGRTMDAQKVILRELNKEFGGSGAAFAETTAGKVELAKHAFGTLGETIFAFVLPPLGRIATVAADALNGLAENGPQIAAYFSDVGDTVGPVVAGITSAVVAGAPVVRSYATAILGVGQSLVTNVLPPVRAAAGFLAGTFGPTLSTVGGIITGSVVPALVAVGGFLATKVIPVLARTATTVGTNLAPVFTAVAGVLNGKVLPAVQAGSNKFRQWWPTIQKVVVVALKMQGAMLGVATKIAGKVLPVVIRMAAFMAGNYVKSIVTAIGVIVRIGSHVVQTGAKFVGAIQSVARFASSVTTKVASVAKTVAGLPGKVTGALSGAATLLKDEGVQIVQGLINGIISKAGSIGSTIQTYIVDKLPGPVRKALEIFSPSRVFKRIGVQIVAGLVVGVRDSSKAIEPAMKKVATLVTTAYKKITGEKIKPELLKRITNSFKDEAAQLRTLANRYDGVQKRIAAAREKLTEVSDFAAQLRQNGIDFAKITGAGVLDEDGNTTAGSITQGLYERLAAIRSFTEKVEQLRAAGLNKTALGQIIAEGVEGGMATAQALVSGGSAAITEVNTLTGQITQAAAGLGDKGAKAMYDGGVQAAAALVKGLESQSAQLDAAASRIGRRMTQAIRKALKGGKANGGKAGAGGAAGRFSVDMAAGSDRPRFSDKAKATGAKAGTPAPVTVKLTAQQLTQLQRGKQIQIDLDAYHGAGGKGSK